MRFRGVSIIVGGAAAALLLALAPSQVEGQRMGVLRPAPRPQLGRGRPRAGVISPHFFSSCFVVPSSAFFPFFPFFGGGVPFVNIQIFAGGQPVPDPSSHLAPDPSAQPVPFPGSHPVPGVHPVPGMQPSPGAVATNPHALPAFPTPVYSAPVYNAPSYGAAAPMTTPQVNGGMVVGDVIVDPTFGLWGGSFFGGGVVCAPSRSFGSRVIIR
jgi:hypothetical protein